MFETSFRAAFLTMDAYLLSLASLPFPGNSAKTLVHADYELWKISSTKEEKNLCMKHAGARHRTGLTDCQQEKVNWRRALLRSVMSGSAWNP